MIVDIVVLNKYLHSAQNLNKKFVDTIFRGEKRKQNQSSLLNSDKIVCCWLAYSIKYSLSLFLCSNTSCNLLYYEEK